MNEVLGFWQSLSPIRRAVVAVATLGVFLGLVGLSRLATTPEMALLYGGLEGHQASEMMQALDASSVRYDVRGTAIFVEAGQRDALRLRFAGDGMLAGGGAGYEILDGLSGFGTTSQMFDAAYWRAREGELARTILSAPGVRQVRVHIAQPPGGAFRRDTRVTAAVIVTAAAGGLGGAQAEAFRHLVASAVPGLTPDRVTVVDAATGRLVGDDTGGAGVGVSTQSQEETLRMAVERLLAARFGPSNAVVQVSVSPVTESETIRERRIDPQSRVAVSTNTEEISTTERNGGGGAVTVASNLPDGDAAGGVTGSESQTAETRSVTNFEISEVIRDIERQPGAVKRLSVAVLLNRGAIGEDTEMISAELEDVRALVAASVGFDPERGDSITVRAMTFEPASALGTQATRGGLGDLLLENPMQLLQLAVLALVTIILAVFVVRPILASRRRPFDAALEPPSSPQAFGNAPFDAPSTALSSGVRDGIESATIGTQALALPSSLDPELVAPMAVDPVTRLKTLIEARQPDTLEILRSWLEDDKIGEKA